MNVGRVMSELARRRPLFHSEADFQHEFAFMLREQFPAMQVRLEMPHGPHNGGATDIVARFDDVTIGIELKYLTKRLNLDVDGEAFRLKAQGATDLRRYDVLKDVERLERFNAQYGGQSYVIALTNDPAYWRAARSNQTIDAAFRLCDDRRVTGELNWANNASAGSIRGREKPISLCAEYNISWKDYSDLGVNAGHFRFLCIEIT